MSKWGFAGNTNWKKMLSESTTINMLKKRMGTSLLIGGGIGAGIGMFGLRRRWGRQNIPRGDNEVRAFLDKRNIPYL